MEMYKKISLITVPLDLDYVLDEFIDRFGIPPKEVTRLLKISLIRALATKCDIKKVEHRDGQIIFSPERPSLDVWSELIAKYTSLTFRATSTPTVYARVKNADEGIDLACAVLREYFKLITPKEEENNAEKK